MSPWLGRVILWYGRGDFVKAEAEVRSALAAGEDTADLRAMLALCLLRSGLTERAAQETRTALARDPDCAFAHYVKSFVEEAELQAMRIPILGPDLRHRGKARACLESARQAVALSPTEARFLLRLAEVQRTVHRRWKACLLATDQALAADPLHLGAAIERAAALNHLRRKAEARETLHRALHAHPGASRAHAGVGWELLRAGDHVRAKAFFDEALRLDASSNWAQAGALEAARHRYRSYRVIAMVKHWFSHLPWGLRGPLKLIALLAGFLTLLLLVAVLDRKVRPYLGDRVADLAILLALVTPVLAAVYHIAFFTWLVREQPAAQTSSAVVWRKSVSTRFAIVLAIMGGIGTLSVLKAYAPGAVPGLCGLLPGLVALWMAFARIPERNRCRWCLAYAALLLLLGPLVATAEQGWFASQAGILTFVALILPILPLVIIIKRTGRARRQQAHDRAVAAVTRNSH